MSTIDFSLDFLNFERAKKLMTECANRKSIKLPPNASVALEGLKGMLDSRDPTPDEVFEEISARLLASGSSVDDAKGFVECVRSMLDAYGGKVKEFITKGFGFVEYGAEHNRHTLVPKILKPGASANEWEWDGHFAQARDSQGGPIVATAVAFTAVIIIPEWIVIAVAVAALSVFIGGLSGGGGKTWIEQIADFFGL